MRASNSSVNESYPSIYSNRINRSTVNSEPRGRGDQAIQDCQNTSSVTEPLSNFMFANTQNRGNGEGVGSFTECWSESLKSMASVVANPIC